MICATLVNTQTHTQTDRQLLTGFTISSASWANKMPMYTQKQTEISSNLMLFFRKQKKQIKVVKITNYRTAWIYCWRWLAWELQCFHKVLCREGRHFALLCRQHIAVDVHRRLVEMCLVPAETMNSRRSSHHHVPARPNHKHRSLISLAVSSREQETQLSQRDRAVWWGLKGNVRCSS